MATEGQVEYPTCDPQFILETAVTLADAILFQKEPIDIILARINAAGVHEIDYTRTVALIVTRMIPVLRQMDAQLCLDVEEDIVDRAVSTFINYWKNILLDIPDSNANEDDLDESYLSVDSIDSSALAAYLGDLYALGHISTKVLTICLGFIVNNFSSVSHLRCVEMVLKRATSYPIVRLGPLYLFECLGTIRKKCRLLFGKEISYEEDRVARLIYHILSEVYDTELVDYDSLGPDLSTCTVKVKLCSAPNPGNCGKVRRPARTSAFNLDSFPLRSVSSTSSANSCFYDYSAFDFDAIYASPDPKDLPPIDF